MTHRYNGNLIPYAKDLRNHMTKEECHLWYDFLRNYPVKFVRQKVIGNYILDFYSPKAHLAVEVDGAQHYEERALAADDCRAFFLAEREISVIRIPNEDIRRNFKEVCRYIALQVDKALTNIQT